MNMVAQDRKQNKRENHILCRGVDSCSLASELFVFFHVPAENVAAWAQDALEALPVELDAFDITAGRNRGLARVVVQQCNLAKVPCWFDLADNTRLASIVGLCHRALALNNNKKLVTLIALLHNDVAILVLHWLQGIGDRQPLPLVQLGQDVDLFQKVFVAFALADGTAHEDAPVRVAVNSPQLHFCLCLDCGGTRSAVDECQFTKAAAGGNVREKFWLAAVLTDPNLNRARVDAVKVVAFVALLDDDVSCGVLDQKHGIKHVRQLVRLQVCKQHVALHSLDQPLHRRSVLWHNLFLVVKGVVGVHDRGTDGTTTDGAWLRGHVFLLVFVALVDRDCWGRRFLELAHVVVHKLNRVLGRFKTKLDHHLFQNALDIVLLQILEKLSFHFGRHVARGRAGTRGVCRRVAFETSFCEVKCWASHQRTTLKTPEHQTIAKRETLLSNHIAYK
eukprot:m.15764 g.15764  ORF g.15764 m.15764 type:complete len:448 (-) comp5083_c0_seq1:963-2306(-)